MKNSDNIRPLRNITLYKRSHCLPIGKKKDSYSIITYAYLNTEDNTITYQSNVKKNWMNDNSQILFTGTYKECYDFIIKAIENQLKEEQ